jgi:flavin-dependent dehydrogenase
MDITPDYDVIVIGSGPAGCAAAITCTQSALTVLIVTDTDYNKNNIDIVESVHSGISFLLLQLKSADSLSKASIGEYEGIESSGIEVDLGGDENGVYVGHHIHRGAFDASLFQIAIQQGVHVRANEKVNDLLFHNDYIVGLRINSGDEILSRYVIDASGNRRFAGKKLKFRETFFSPPLTCWTGISVGIENANPILRTG